MVQEVTIAELFDILHSADGSRVDIEKEYVCNGDLEEYEVKTAVNGNPYVHMTFSDGNKQVVIQFFYKTSFDKDTLIRTHNYRLYGCVKKSMKGYLYFNLLEQMINSDKKMTDEEIEEKIKSNFKMKGLILADVRVAKMQDNNLMASTSSKIIPAYMDKTENLSPKKSSIATREEFEKLQKYVNNTIKEISEEILNGNIKLKPYYKNKKTPCEYCSYKNVCGFNSGIFKSDYNFINKKQKEDIFEKLEKEK